MAGKLKRILKRFAISAPQLSGRDWEDVRPFLQRWAEYVTNILDAGGTEEPFDSHQNLEDLQGGTEDERFHFTLAQHSYLAPHQIAGDPHPLYQLRIEKAAADGYAALDPTVRVPVAQLGSGPPDGTKFLRDDRVWSVVPTPLLGIKAITFADTPYTVLAADDLIVVDATSGAVTLTLPAVASSNGRQIRAKKTDASANVVKVDGNGAETVDGAADLDLLLQHEVAAVVCDGTEWWVY